MRRVDVRLPDGSLLCHARVADGFLSRGVGLLGKRGLALDEGLLIVPCSSVHTWFMRFPIDVLFLDREDTVVKLARMPAFRMALGGKGARNVLELTRGAIERHGLAPGMRLALHEAPAA